MTERQDVTRGAGSYQRQVIFDAIQNATDGGPEGVNISVGAFLDSLERDFYEVRYVGPGDEPQ